MKLKDNIDFALVRTSNEEKKRRYIKIKWSKYSRKNEQLDLQNNLKHEKDFQNLVIRM